MEEQRLEELKKKYQAALDQIKKLGVQLKNLHVQDNKLVLRAEAKTKGDSYKVWNQIKAIDPGYARDLMAEITYLSDKVEEAPAPRMHKVKPGESLSKIAKKYYGNASEYMKIFEANRDKLKDPNKIFPDQELIIP